MLPALRLRLLEARRRGFLWLALAGAACVFLTAWRGGATPDGRYGLASDLAATTGYLLAVFLGAFPVAIDRERRRSYLPAASPATPWGWALGNALGAGAVAAAAMALLFASAGLGASAGGGVDTWDVGRVPGGPYWLPRQMELRGDEDRVRARVRAYATAGATPGTAFQASVEVAGRRYEVEPDSTTVFEVPAGGRVWFRPGDDSAHVIGLDEIRTLRERRGFLPNALLASVGPALGAAALAVVATAAGACLAAPVAALLVVLLLLLGGMKGFLLETLEHEGALERGRVAGAPEADDGHDDEHGHDHGTGAPAPGARTHEAAKRVLRAALFVVPTLDRYDRSDRVALGEWTGARGAVPALATLLAGLAAATLFGALGLATRRAP